MSNERMMAFQVESNKIEGIYQTTQEEVDALEDFVKQNTLTVNSVSNYVYVCSGAKLRRYAGMDVRVANHIAPAGGPHMEKRLEALLDSAGEMNAYQFHVAYETLHPYMDGNGRSGRALWLWHHRKYNSFFYPNIIFRGFLHQFYYEALDAARVAE